MRIVFELLVKLCLLAICSVELCALDFKYHKYEELTRILTNFSLSFPKLHPNMYSVGTSVKGRKLWVVEVTAADGSKLGIPNVKLIGNIHGNEAVGREVLLHFLEFLGSSYGSDRTVTWLLENTRLHVMPSMNPDGFEVAHEGICAGQQGRGNARNNADLNRNFPDFYMKSMIHPPQPESDAIQSWMKEVPFVLSASLHGGALVANYPFDTVKETKWEKLFRNLMETDHPEEQQNLRDAYIASYPVNPPSISADDDVFVHLAKVYANKHPKMHLGLSCPDALPNENFTGGITNGAAWYPFWGGMQDYNYFAHGCMELTLEISCCKYPHARELPKLWDANKYALLELVKQAQMGVRGMIFSNETQMPINAALKITGRDMNFTTSKNGEFWRILLPGKYQLEVNAKGYHSELVDFEVSKMENFRWKPTILYLPLVDASVPRLFSSTDSAAEVEVAGRTTTEASMSVDLQENNYSGYLQGEAHDAPITLKSTGSKIGAKNYDYLELPGGDAPRLRLSAFWLLLPWLVSTVTWG